MMVSASCEVEGKAGKSQKATTTCQGYLVQDRQQRSHVSRDGDTKSAHEHWQFLHTGQTTKIGIVLRPSKHSLTIFTLEQNTLQSPHLH